MPRTDLACAQPPQAQSKKRRSRRRKRHRSEAPAAAAGFSQLEQAFFAAGCLEEPVAPPEPESFEQEQVFTPPPFREAWFEALRYTAGAMRAVVRSLLASVRGQRNAPR